MTTTKTPDTYEAVLNTVDQVLRAADHLVDEVA